MKKMLAMFAAVALAIGANSATLPAVGTGTAPNAWTTNLSGVFAAAKTTGYPVFLAMINDSSTGAGCQHCWNFVVRTLNNPEFARIVSTYKFYMVLINNGGADTFSNEFIQTYNTYGGYLGGDLPLVALFDSDGNRATNWSQAATELTDFWSWIEWKLKEMTVSDTVLTLTASSASNVLAPTETWSGAVVRTGGSGVPGNATVTLSGQYAAEYVATPAVLSWGAADGAVGFTVSRAATTSRIIADDLVVTVTGSGFDGSTISYGNSALPLVFKDPRVGATLAQFAAAHPGLDGLSGNWFVPSAADGKVLETIVTDEASTLTWTATAGGILKVAGDAEVAVNGAGWTYSLADGATTIGVKPGDVVTFTVAPTPVAGEVTAGLTDFTFTPLAVTLTKPQDGADIPYAALLTDSTLVDMAWDSNSADPDVVYEVFGGLAGVDLFATAPLYAGGDKTLNAITAGFVKTDAPMGDCSWAVRVTDKTAKFGTAVSTASASFSISSVAKFSDTLPTEVTVYLKAGTALNYAANESSNPPKYSARGLPVGMKINSATGVIEGTPKKAGKYSVTIYATNTWGTSTYNVNLTVAKLPASVKASYSGILFDADGNMTGSLTWKSATTGKWTGTLYDGAKKISIRSTFVFDENGRISFPSGAITVVPLEGTAVMTGNRNGSTLYAVKTTNSAGGFGGNWNGVLGVDGAEGSVGYAVAKVTVKGKVTLAGKILASQRISGTMTAAVFDAAFIAEHLPRWSKGCDAMFAYVGKSQSRITMTGGFMLGGDQLIGGAFTVNGAQYAITDGGKWNAPALSGLDGKTLTSSDGTSFGLAAAGVRVTAVQTGAKEKFSAAPRTGIFKGSYKTSGSAKFEGVLFNGADGALCGAGGGAMDRSTPVSVTVK